MSARGGLTNHTSSISPLSDVLSTHRIILPPGHHLYPSQNNEAHRSLHQIPLPTWPTCPRHACRIINAVPLPPSKSVITSHSAASEPLFATTTAHGASPLPRSPHPCCKYPVLASSPPTPPLSPDACQCAPPVSGFPVPWSPLTLPRFSTYRPSASWPSTLSYVWGIPHALPPASWKFPQTKTRSNPY